MPLTATPSALLLRGVRRCAPISYRSQHLLGFWVALQLPRSKANTLTGGSDEALIVIGLAAVAITALLHAAIRGILEREKATYGTATALWLIGAVYSMSWISLLTR